MLNRQDRDEEAEIELRKKDGSVTRSTGGSDKAAGPANGERSLKSGQNCWLNEDVGRTAKGDEKKRGLSMSSCFVRGKPQKFRQRKPRVQRGKLSLGPGGWIRAILAKSCARNEDNASPN